MALCTPPVSPSASPHRVPILLRPRLLCPSFQSAHAVPGQYIDRSATMGSVEVMDAETSV